MLDNTSSQAKKALSQTISRQLPAENPISNVSNFAVVGIGASAGGLEACTRLVDGLPAGNGMAFVLVQHLDPTHDNSMADVVASHTSMTVRQATQGMRIEPDHFYVVPPGTFLSVANGTLHFSRTQARHDAHQPFDFMLRSLAAEFGPRTICLILSGSGGDGCLGLKAVKESFGLVISQDPAEASFDGMSRNAIMTGAVDIVLPVAKIPEALVKFSQRFAVAGMPRGSVTEDSTLDRLPEIVELLRAKTNHNFALYKPSTLQRRIDRRMAIAGIESKDTERYLNLLRTETSECGRLANDLLTNVTSFFHDPHVFDLLAKTIIPDLVRDHPPGQPLRVWVAGCGTGEEAYSLAMLFHEEITTAHRNVELQVFASDVDPDAVVSARDGLFAETIAEDVSPSRLARFFSKADNAYRISPEIRATVVFTVQDVLSDPPFWNLDLLSCRSMLVHLRREAQEKVVSLFHFAIREGGILMVGNVESVSVFDGRFELIAKAERLYRHIGGSVQREPHFPISQDNAAATPERREQRPVGSCPTEPTSGHSASVINAMRVTELERELETTRKELRVAIQEIEISTEEQRAVNEDLIALNNQLEETLTRQQAASNDLQNILYSTNIATLFLDADLNIRFFTPSTRELFNIIPSDIGRPLADLHSLAADTALLEDARTVLRNCAGAIEREIHAPSGAWHTRCILPFRVEDNRVGGVVITFADITGRKQAAHALENAKRLVQAANIGKSRLVAVA